MYNSFVSAIAMSYEKIQCLKLGDITYTIRFQGRRTVTNSNCLKLLQLTFDHCYFVLDLCFNYYILV